MKEQECKDYPLTAEQESALKLIQERPPFIFITGKAGTGKSTFIRQLVKTLKAPIVAPTGIAAINARGQTIHSFFRLPMGAVTFEDVEDGWHSFPRNYVRMVEKLKSLRYLIIDEISMVRSDVMQVIDDALRSARRNPDVPFGGVTVVAFGDLFQLPPVVRQGSQEHAFLQHHFGHEFFFGAKAFADKDAWHALEFTQVFRQKDQTFVDYLNAVREDNQVSSVCSALNSRCYKLLEQGEEFVCVLATTNKQVDGINESRMDKIEEEEVTYEGILDGKFKDRVPVPERLILKKGAQVMFLKNDLKANGGRWVNGTTGIVQGCERQHVDVKLRDGTSVQVRSELWESVEYDFDSSNGQLSRRPLGTYRQIPLVPAWAQTIHKSQGKTMSRVHIDMGRGAFAAGQAYVALSRCTSLDGVSLERPLKLTDIQCNPIVVNFYKELRNKGA